MLLTRLGEHMLASSSGFRTLDDNDDDNDIDLEAVFCFLQKIR